MEIINAQAFSKLIYCSSVWINTTQAYLDNLQAVQHFACRILCGAKKFDRVTPLCWLSVRQHLYLRFAVLVFKSMTGMGYIGILIVLLKVYSLGILVSQENSFCYTSFTSYTHIN